MLTAVSVIIVFSVLILVHEAGHFFMAKRMGVRVEKFSFGFGPALFSFKKKETEYLICAIPLGGYVKMAGEEPDESLKGEQWEYLSKPPIKRFAIVLTGPLTNYIFAFLLFAAIFVIGVPTNTTEIGEVMEDFPAYSAGIKEGDKIISIDGVRVKYWGELFEEISKHTSGTPINVSLLRNKKEHTLTLTPKVMEVKNIFGQKIKSGKMGIIASGETEIVRTGFGEGLYLGGKKTLEFTYLTYKMLWHLITGGMPIRESVAGPIFIASMIGKAARMGFINLIFITAHINLAIAIFNLLPFPVLDGGHILFLALEKVRGRRLSPRVQQVITQAAVSLLIALAIFVSLNDIIRLFAR